MRARSTAASVCPARTSTPPSRARSGNTWPGPREVGRLRLRIDRGQHRRGAIGRGDAGASRDASRRSGRRTRCRTASVLSLHRQRQLELVEPLARSSTGRSGRGPCLAMKLMISGVTFSAATVRSPSFSRSSSSTTMIMRPSRKASTASSIGANGDRVLPGFFCHAFDPVAHDFHRAQHVLAEHVALEVHQVVDPGELQVRVLPRDTG